MAWLILVIAGLLEIAWAVGLKYSNGFTKFWPSLLVIAGGFSSVWLLGIAMKSIPLGTAYAMWTGIGIVGTVVTGMAFFHESVEIFRFVFIFCILTGIIGLRCLS